MASKAKQPAHAKQKSTTSTGAAVAQKSRTTPKGQSTSADGAKFLKAQNDTLKTLARDISRGEAPERIEKLRQLCVSWLDHNRLLEEVVTPELQRAGVDDKDLLEVEIERDMAGLLVADLVARDPGDEAFESETNVLCRLLPRLVQLEDKVIKRVFEKAKASGLDTTALGSSLQAEMAKRDENAEEKLHLPSPRHLRGAGTTTRSRPKETGNMRGNERERDERGRFMDDDDDRRGGSSRSSRSSGGGSRSSGRGRDDERGWHGDSQGHSEASRRGWEERRSRDYDDDDDDRRSSRGRSGSQGRSSSGSSGGRRTGGWFGDSEGHSEASRRGWENSDHGDSGWYGDREGHSQASRRGWQNPDHGDSGWFGDREGHSQASRRGWDNPNHGESGWFGDSEGHSEASRRGWEHRGGSRSSGGGSGRGRGYEDDDYDDRRRSRRRD